PGIQSVVTRELAFPTDFANGIATLVEMLSHVTEANIVFLDARSNNPRGLNVGCAIAVVCPNTSENVVRAILDDHRWKRR
ncbi:MAG: hypothetical protein ACK58T_36575, partial [Phycisphaerae bacterium]